MSIKACMAERKIALVTGANKGIGFEMSRQLTGRGVHVLVAARDHAKAAQAAGQIGAEPLALDVTSAASIAAAAEAVAAAHGRLDILINNAGALFDSDFFHNTTLELSEENLRRSFDTNFFGAVAVTHAFLPLLHKSAAGRIVNMSSILGSLTLHADPASPIAAAKSFAYNASKTALNAFTIHLADALKNTPIKVNSAHPGWVKTDMGGEQAPMELSDGAKTGVDLALLGPEGPTGGYFHLGKPLPW